jgi:hypothetical protein
VGAEGVDLCGGVKDDGGGGAHARIVPRRWRPVKG